MFIPFAIETDRDWEFRQRHPYAVYTLLATYIAIHVMFAALLSPAQWSDVLYRFGVVQWEFAWYSFITCTFLHVGWLHLIGNCLFLWVYGSTLERFLGSARFLMLYIAGALLSTAVHLETLSPFSQGVPTVGASGAISAVLGAFFALLPKSRLRCVFFFFVRPFVVTLPAFVVLGLWFIGQLYFSLEPVSASEEVAFWAHVAGFAAGAVFGVVLHGRLKRSGERDEMHRLNILGQAWSAFFRGDESSARTLKEAYDAQCPRHEEPSTALLTACLAKQTSAELDAMHHYLHRAYNKAMNALQYSTVVTVYLT
ncbi:MAG: rhomboid family intramembrane serine protease, partial [Candidatus Pacebacteria bacterium]|nr:rhomboid family intramembrane serine protease [Candidatus Paceibacterota bacterium]